MKYSVNPQIWTTRPDFLSRNWRLGNLARVWKQNGGLFHHSPLLAISDRPAGRNPCLSTLSFLRTKRRVPLSIRLVPIRSPHPFDALSRAKQNGNTPDSCSSRPATQLRLRPRSNVQAHVLPNGQIFRLNRTTFPSHWPFITGDPSSIAGAEPDAVIGNCRLPFFAPLTERGSLLVAGSSADGPLDC
jgi:hypothetical protein